MPKDTVIRSDGVPKALLAPDHRSLSNLNKCVLNQRSSVALVATDGTRSLTVENINERIRWTKTGNQKKDVSGTSRW